MFLNSDLILSVLFNVYHMINSSVDAIKHVWISIWLSDSAYLKVNDRTETDNDIELS